MQKLFSRLYDWVRRYLWVSARMIHPKTVPMHEDSSGLLVTILIEGKYTEIQPVFRDGFYEGERTISRRAPAVFFHRARTFKRIVVAAPGSPRAVVIQIGRYRQPGVLVAPWLFKVEHELAGPFQLDRIQKPVKVEIHSSGDA